MKNTRKQLTLFLDEKESISIEEIRKEYNSKQYELIKSHITLCREDEIEDLEIILNNLRNLNIENFELDLEQVKRTSDGKGVLIPVIDKKKTFQNLRKSVLNSINKNPRNSEPHITLMHPRNSTCEDYMFEKIKNITLPEKVKIGKISLIEQEIEKEWKVIKEYKLKINPVLERENVRLVTE